MKQEQENRAKQIFEEKYIESLGGIEKCLDAKFQCNGWKRNNISVYTNVILPSIVQALSESTSAENAPVQVAENSSDTDQNEKTMDKIYSFVSELDKPESKIQPGQKLNEGDWCFINSRLKASQLFELEGIGEGFIDFHSDQAYEYGIILYTHGTLGYNHIRGTLKTKHPFTDFKQLCKNTFQS